MPGAHGCLPGLQAWEGNIWGLPKASWLSRLTIPVKIPTVLPEDPVLLAAPSGS